MRLPSEQRPRAGARRSPRAGHAATIFAYGAAAPGVAGRSRDRLAGAYGAAALSSNPDDLIMAISDVLNALQSEFVELGLTPKPLMVYPDGRDSGQMSITIPADRLIDVMTFLKEDSRCRMDQLCDITCVDYLNFPDAEDRFGLSYSLLSLAHNHRLWVRVYVNDPSPSVPSLCPVWQGAEWLEREVYDMFGINFVGHPDLRRILMPANFQDFPLRKDYPLHGKGERERFDVITRETTDLEL